MTNSIITSEEQKEITQKIFYDRVKILHQHLLVTSLPAFFLCATLVFLGLYPLENKPLVLSWYLASIFVCILRIGLLRWYERDLRHPAFHLKLFICGVTLSGLIWGFAGTLLTPPQNILPKVFIIIIIAGLSAGGCQTLKASRAANSLFILTSIFPLALGILFQKQPLYIYLSLSLFGYLGFMLFLAHKTYTQFINSLQLHYENEILLNQLKMKNAQMKKINDQLSEEVIEHTKAKNRLRYLASHDSLTGIDNRLSFDEQFGKILARSKSQNSEFCVMYIDVDHFKMINDNYGHDIGDSALIEVGRRLKKNLNEQDSLVRIGGDEFVILMAESAVKQIAEDFCQRVLKDFTVPFELNGYTLFISVSIGGSFFPENGDNKKILLKKADLALYRAKKAGRNCYAFYAEEMKIFE